MSKIDVELVHSFSIEKIIIKVERTEDAITDRIEMTIYSVSIKQAKLKKTG